MYKRQEVKEGEILLKTDTTSQTTLDIQREQFKQQLSAARQEYDRLYGSNGSAAAALKAAESEYRLAKKNYDNGVVLAQQGGFIAQMCIRDSNMNELYPSPAVYDAAFTSYRTMAQLFGQEGHGNSFLFKLEDVYKRQTMRSAKRKSRITRPFCLMKLTLQERECKIPLPFGFLHEGHRDAEELCSGALYHQLFFNITSSTESATCPHMSQHFSNRS